MNTIEYFIFNKDVFLDFSDKTISDDIRKLYSDWFNNDVKYMDVSFSGDNLYFVAVEDDKTVGMLCLTYYKDGCYDFEGKHEGLFDWCSTSISVDPKYQGKGIAKQLMKNMFRFCEKENIGKILKSSYTEDGLRYLKGMSEKMQSEYPSVKIYG